MIRFNQLVFGLGFVFSSAIMAQVSESEVLFKVLELKDQALFKQGFNQCDLSITASLISDDLEFYHDQGGVDKGKAAFLNTLKNGLCQTGQNKIARHLVSGSLKVFPMYDQGELYGAIQIGEHNFAPSGEPVVVELPARFTHLWLLQDGEWRLARVLSYDHH
ncbi:nuclear transport factor 2 family protein [Aliiglaciecola litoralis]|uniref:DUF4440 domain-containing protein n=1 Tax=Aliiglaciecola litoralis TaxID=582857 RepID=A0ABN1LQ90_9ALTE